MRRISQCLGAGLVLLVAASVSGCGAKSPEEKVAKLRSFYSARLNGFILNEEPIVPEVPELAVVEVTEDGTEGEAVEEVAIDPMPAIEVAQTVQLDVLIQHRSEERLPGITLDISMVDSGQVEKGHWRVWFDTSEVIKATVTQFTHILGDVGYEEGDGFFLEVRHPVPVEERSEYREFSTSP